MKPSHEPPSTSRLNFSPLLQTTLLFNPKLFNGALNEQLTIQQQQRNYSKQQQQQSPQLKTANVLQPNQLNQNHLSNSASIAIQPQNQQVSYLLQKSK